MRLLTGFGIAVFTGCLLGGVGYTVAVLRYSGEPLAPVAHPETEGTFTAPLDLDPAMNPLRAGLDARYSQTLGRARLSATVTLRAPDGTTAWTHRLRVSDGGGGGIGTSTSVSMPLDRFEVAAAGRYAVEITLDDTFGAHLVSASVSGRRTVRALDWTLLGGLAGGGVLGMVRALGANALRAPAHRPARMPRHAGRP